MTRVLKFAAGAEFNASLELGDVLTDDFHCRSVTALDVLPAEVGVLAGRHEARFVRDQMSLRKADRVAKIP